MNAIAIPVHQASMPGPFGLPGGVRGGAKELAAAAIARTEAVVREETSALKAARPIDMRETTNRKSQLIVDLNASLKLLGASGLSSELQQRLEVLRSALVENMAAIKVHLEAAHEISGLLSQAAYDADSDGTYSRTPSGRRGF